MCWAVEDYESVCDVTRLAIVAYEGRDKVVDEKSSYRL